MTVPDHAPRTDIHMTCDRCKSKSPVGTPYDQLWDWLTSHACPPGEAA